MKMALWLATILLGATSVGVACASEITDASLHRLLTLSGERQEVQRFPGLLRVGIKMAEKRVESKATTAKQKAALADEYGKMEDAVGSAFVPADILSAVAEQLKHNVSEQDAHALLAWLNSPLGRRIRKAEENASTVAAYRQKLALGKTLLADKPLVHFAMEQDKLLHLTTMLMNIKENMVVAWFVASSGAGHTVRPARIKAFRAKVAARLEHERPQFEQYAILSEVYTFRHFKMDSLRRYRAFTKTPPALRAHKSIVTGLEIGFKQANRKLAKAVVSNGHRCPPGQPEAKGTETGQH